MKDGIFQPTNPWPEPQPDSEQVGRVWRSWTLVVSARLHIQPGDFSADPDVRLLPESDRSLTVRIRSDNPATCDVHEVMEKTRCVFASVDARWPVVSVQGVPKDRWLFLG